MPNAQIQWQYFPRYSPCPEILRSVVDSFVGAADQIDSFTHEKQESNDVLAIVRPGLEKIGFQVESGKSKADKIKVPVLYGANGRIEKYFEADAYHPQCKVVLEVEAGRGYTNNQFLKDLFQACVMQDVDFAAIAVRQVYRNSRDYEKIVVFIQTLYSSDRLKLPLNGVLLIGY